MIPECVPSLWESDYRVCSQGAVYDSNLTSISLLSLPYGAREQVRASAMQVFKPRSQNSGGLFRLMRSDHPEELAGQSDLTRSPRESLVWDATVQHVRFAKAIDFIK